MSRNIFSKEKDEYKILFKKVFDRDILPEYKLLEHERVKQFNKFKFFLVGSILSLIVAIFCAVKGESEFVGKYICISGIIFSVFCFLCASFVNFCFVADIKSKCMQRLVSHLGNIIWRQGFISRDDIVASQLFPLFASKTSDDTFKGIYKGVEYSIDETVLCGESGTTAFKGIIIKFDFNKNFTGKTIIVDKLHFKILFNDIVCYVFLTGLAMILFFLGVATFFTHDIFIMLLGICLFFLCGCIIYEFRKLNPKNSKKFLVGEFENLSALELEDVDFKKKYFAYSSDQVEGRYLITTAFMLRFQNLQRAFGNSNVKCSFYNNRLMFAISTNKNLFEIGSIHKPLTDFKVVEKCLDEIISILLIIDYLKLNQKIGL